MELFKNKRLTPILFLLLFFLTRFVTVVEAHGNVKNILNRAKIIYAHDVSVHVKTLGFPTGWDWDDEVQKFFVKHTIEPPDLFVTQIWYVKFTLSLKETYPDKKVLLYRNFRMVNRKWNEDWAYNVPWRIPEFEFARDNNIILKDGNGNYIYSEDYGRDYLLANISSPKWHKFVADWVKFYINNYGVDGVYLDNGLGCRRDEIYFGVSATPDFTNEEIIQAYIQGHKKIREVIGDGILFTNGIYHGERFFNAKSDYVRILNKYYIDGFQSEGIFGGSFFWGESRWKKSIEFIQWIQDNWLSKGKIFCSHLNFAGTSWVGKEAGYSLEESSRFHYTSTLLGIESEVSYLNFFSPRNGWYESWAQEMLRIDVGTPLGDYYLAQDQVYVREFTKATVCVNPSSSPHTFDGITLAAYEGRIIQE